MSVSSGMTSWRQHLGKLSRIVRGDWTLFQHDHGSAAKGGPLNHPRSTGYLDFAHDGTLYTQRVFANTVTNVNMSVFGAAQGLVEDRLFAVPLAAPIEGPSGSPPVIDFLGTEVVTADSGHFAKLYVFSNVNGYPGELLAVTGDLDLSSTGYVEEQISLSLTAGQRVWVAVNIDRVITAVLRGISVNSQSHAMGKDAVGTGSQGALYYDYPYSSDPDPFPLPPTAIIVGNIPGIYVRWA